MGFSCAGLYFYPAAAVHADCMSSVNPGPLPTPSLHPAHHRQRPAARQGSSLEPGEHIRMQPFQQAPPALPAACTANIGADGAAPHCCRLL
jgi:hypothetical protein